MQVCPADEKLATQFIRSQAFGKDIRSFLRGCEAGNLRLNAFHISAALTGSRSEWINVLDLLSSMASRAIRLDAFVLGAAQHAVRGWDVALSLFQSGCWSTVQVNPSIGACAHHWGLACGIFEQALAARAADVVSYNSIVDSLGARGWRWSAGVVRRMAGSEIRADSITYNSVMAVGRWTASLALLAALRGKSLRVRERSFGATLKVNTSHWQRACKLVEAVSENGLESNVVMHHTLLATFPSGSWARGLQEVASLQSDQLLDCKALVAGIAAVSKASWHLPLTLFVLHLRDCPSSTVACNAAVRTVSEGHAWFKALDLYRRAMIRNLVPDLITWGSLLQSFEVLARWRNALHLVVPGSEIISNSAVSCCEKASLWPMSLELLRGMPRHRLSMETMGCNAAIAACGAANVWRQALSLMTSMPLWTTVSCSEGATAAARYTWAASLRLLTEVPGAAFATSLGALLDAAPYGQQGPLLHKLARSSLEALKFLRGA